VLDDLVLFKNLIKDMEGTPSINHKIFGNNLEPIHRGLLFKNMPVVRDAEANADAVVGLTVKTIGGHREGGKPGRRSTPVCHEDNLFLRSVGGATAFALAIVFAFATVITGFATACAFARVVTFASVLVGFCLPHRGGLDGGLADHRGRGGGLEANGAPGDETCDGGADEESFSGTSHVFPLVEL